MSMSRARIIDSIEQQADYNREPGDGSLLRGHGSWILRGPDGRIKTRGVFKNLITEVGDQMYGERAAGIGALLAPTGMRLGTGVTAVAKTGAGAAIVTYVSGSSRALNGAATSALQGSSRRIQYVVTWPAGVATANNISEAVLTIIAIADVAGAAANTASRALLSPVVNKGAGDSFTLTWNHDLLGA